MACGVGGSGCRQPAGGIPACVGVCRSRIAIASTRARWQFCPHPAFVCARRALSAPRSGTVTRRSARGILLWCFFQIGSSCWKATLASRVAAGAASSWRSKASMAHARASIRRAVAPWSVMVATKVAARLMWRHRSANVHAGDDVALAGEVRPVTRPQCLVNGAQPGHHLRDAVRPGRERLDGIVTGHGGLRLGRRRDHPLAVLRMGSGL